MRGHRVSVGIAAAVLLGTSLASMAQRELSAEDRREAEQIIAKENRRNFAGWNGILIYCPNDEQSDESLSKICANTYTNAEFLAATANLELRRAKNSFDLAYASRVGDLLILEVSISGTKRGIPSAVHASLQAYARYSAATEDSRTSLERKSARSKPRSGDLIFWKREIIGASSGNGDDLVQPLSHEVEQLLKQFFAEYIKARK